MKKRTTEQPPEPAAETVHYPGLSGIPRRNVAQPPSAVIPNEESAVPDPDAGADSAAEDQ